MHGRLKIKTTKEQEEAKKLEQQKKLKTFVSLKEKLFFKRENGEYDEEALSLTEKALLGNPDFQIMWIFRKEILLAMKPQKTEDELQKLGLGELSLTEACFQKNIKSYGTWDHRVWALEYMPNPDWKQELKKCNQFLKIDDRNFHCWDYRRLMKTKCNVDDKEELDFTYELIANNFSNYSAWHYRSKLLPIVHPGPQPGSVDEQTLHQEYELVQNAAFTDPNDQSAWFYHRWLLGRGVQNLEVLQFGILKQLGTIIIHFSNPIKILPDRIKVSINEIAINSKWVAVDKPPVNGSRLWYCCVHGDVLTSQEKLEISVNIVDEAGDSILNFNNSGDICYNSPKTDIFRADISAATKDVLEKELESCEQLYQLEPENKWTLFTSVLLMRAINNPKYESTISDYFDQLINIDALRKCYYQDLKSKFAIEYHIENMSPGTDKLLLQGKRLTSLHHFENFCLVKYVDLSDNELSSLYPIRFLLAVEELILDDNKITSCEDIESLLCLKILSLKNNNIESMQSLESLKTCTSLQAVILEGNPIEKPIVEEKVKTNLKSHWHSLKPT